MEISSEKELRLWRSIDLPPKSDFLLLLVPRAPVRFGQVLFPEKLGEFTFGDVVHFTQGKEMLADEGDEESTPCIFVKVLPEDCVRVPDPQVADGYRWVINNCSGFPGY